MLTPAIKRFDSACRRLLPSLGIPWWTGFALAWFLPLATLAFFLTGPHAAGDALLWTAPVWLLIVADRVGPREVRNVPAHAPRAFFDTLLHGLVAFQLANVLAMGWMVSRLDFSLSDPASLGTAFANLLALRILGGTNACCSVIAPAHELIHRRTRWQRRWGRILLMTVFYDHFHVAHRLGHHARLGSAGDPSTAEPREDYEAFCRRSLRQQWRIAWQHQPGTVRQGLLVQLALMAAYGVAFGGLALFAWCYINLVAVRLLEAVNYFQHFGMTQASGRARDTAWRCESALSLFLFLGLTRHADHHRRPGIAYPELLDRGGPACLPHGYLWTAIWVKNRSGSFRRWAAGQGFGAEAAGHPCRAAVSGEV